MGSADQPEDNTTQKTVRNVSSPALPQICLRIFIFNKILGDLYAYYNLRPTSQWSIIRYIASFDSWDYCFKNSMNTLSSPHPLFKRNSEKLRQWHD